MDLPVGSVSLLKRGLVLALFFFGYGLNYSTYAQNNFSESGLTPLQEIHSDSDGDGISDIIGDTVTVAGVANIATGQLHEIFLQVFIQNESAGLSLFSKSFDKPVNRGDSVVARGVVQQYYGLNEIYVIDYWVYDGATYSPDPISFSNAVMNPLPYEGMMVHGSGTVVGKGTKFNGKYLDVSPSDSSTQSMMVYVSNFHHQYQEFDFESISIGDRVEITGVLSKYDPDYPDKNVFKVFLRTPNDFRTIGITQSTLTYLGIGGIILALLVAAWIFSLRSRVKNKTRQIRKSLDEKEILLKEIHHRVKNNLAIISGLIELQLDSSLNEEAQKVLQDSQTRIKSMALVHDKLYRTSSLTDIGMKTYIEELVQALKSTFVGPNSAIELTFEIDDINLDIDRAIPCGLLINELVVNAFKHAFEKKQGGYIRIALKRSGNQIVLTVADNGKGLPDDFGNQLGSSLGLMLIETFKDQLEATRKIENKNGAHFTFFIPSEPSH